MLLGFFGNGGVQFRAEACCTMKTPAVLAVAIGVLAATCLLLMLAGTSSRAILQAEGPPLGLAPAETVRARRISLADRPGGHIPQQILRNINGLWHKSISGKRTKNRKTGGFNLPKEVLHGKGHQWESDPYVMLQKGLDSGNPDIIPARMMRRMTVRRQWHWNKGSGITGGPTFIQSGMVPPKVPVLGNGR